MTDFLAMGGYAWYVWMSYGACALAIAVEVAAVRARRRRALEELKMSAPEARGSVVGVRGSR
jgi:heme exporter protein D